ncbi:MAG: hypothetical protein L0Y39_04305 [Methylococcaceae bacterium]|nr:hypothetical protein [Methylococcaceae bacterium]
MRTNLNSRLSNNCRAVWIPVFKCGDRDRQGFSVLCIRYLYFVLLLIPLGLAISALALAVCFATIFLSVLVCLAYRILWYGGPQGRLYRYTKKVAKRKGQIEETERMRRIKLSRRSDQQNIGELTSMVFEELDQRKQEIMIDISVLARIQLRECIEKMDFQSAMEIYQALTQTPADTLNQRLGHLVGSTREGWLR